MSDHWSLVPIRLPSFEQPVLQESCRPLIFGTIKLELKLSASYCNLNKAPQESLNLSHEFLGMLRDNIAILRNNVTS